MSNLIIVGAGRFGRFTRELAASCNRNVIGFVDDTLEIDSLIDGSPILGSIQQIETLSILHCSEVAICISNMPKRKMLMKECKEKNIVLNSLIHTTVIQSTRTTIGKGVIMQPYTVLQTGAIVEDNVLVEEHCSIGVDVLIGSNTVLAPHVVLTGSVKVGSNCFIGANTVVNPEVNISEGSIIGSGSTVLNDTESNFIYAGSPAKKIRKIN